MMNEYQDDEVTEKDVLLIAQSLVQFYGDKFDLHRAYELDKIGVNTAFNDLVDSLQKDGAISEMTTYNIVFEFDGNTSTLLITCFDTRYNITIGLFL